MTLNLLRNFCFNTKLSAHVALHGTFEYNKTPLAPLGTRVLVHEKPENCCTWAPYGTNGWSIGPYLEHYLCVEYYIPSTHSTIIAGTVEFISTVTPIPKTSLEDYLRQSITYIMSLLEDPNLTVPSLSFGGDTQNLVKQITTLLNRAIPALKPIKIKLLLFPLILYFHRN